ncbi:MAG TPA: hypothetical protein VF112_01760 [Candidatus Dormibacteraeota bacterium]
MLAVAGSAAANGGVAARSRKPPAAATPFTVWVQTMDSCKQALPGGAVTLTGGGVARTATAAAGRKRSVVPTASCPLTRGSCTAVAVGCVSFSGLAAGTYRLVTATPPPADRSDPEGFAPCQGGSACRSETATVTVSASGAVTAQVVDVYPDGVSETFPSATASFAGSETDPVVLHDFGMAPPGFAPQCDGDSDADDHLTGNMRGHCGYPEADEASACRPYPWSCASPAVATGARP